MLVKIDGKIVEVIGKTLLPNTVEKLDRIIVPNIEEDAENLLDAIDKFNYGVLSKTETGEFLYRYSRHGADFYLGGEFVNDVLKKSLLETGDMIEQIFLWWL